MAEIHLTHRVLEDLQDIYDYSIAEWGEQVADAYLNDIQEFMLLLQSNPALLRKNSQISNRFKSHLVKSHWLICEVIDEDIYVLTMKHMSMNLIVRLSKLEPSLENEALALYKELKKRKRQL